jgi:predicted RNase H-like nuclease
MQIAGAEVWKGRWVVVVLDDGRFIRAIVAPTIEEAAAELADVAAIGIDMPIGLLAAATRRPADFAARDFVGKRRNSVFFTPLAELLEKATPAEANVLARSQGWPGIAAQTFALKKQLLAVQPLVLPMSGSGRCIPRSPSQRPMAVSRSNGQRPAGMGPRCAHASRVARHYRVWGPGDLRT